MLEPVFKQTKAGPSLADTDNAMRVRLEQRQRHYVPPMSAAKVRAEAEISVRRVGGDVSNKKHLLGQFRIQFGIFRGETFQWLASNALGYAAFLAADSEKEPNSASANYLNKMALRNYLKLFPEGVQAVQKKKTEKKPTVKVQATTEVLSSTDDQELLAAAEQMEKEMEASQQNVPEQAQTQESGNLTSGNVQRKRVRTVSGAPKKTLRSLIFGHATASTQSSAAVVTSEQSSSLPPTTEALSQSSSGEESRPSTSETSQLMSLTPILSREQSSATEVPLFKKWRNTLPSVDHRWISSALFYRDHLDVGRLDTDRISGLWLHPPQAPLIPQSAPKLYHFFGHRVFLWMPVKLWSLKLSCPHSDCENPELSYAGVYQVVRQVLDVSNFYNLVSETLLCRRCKRKMVSWSHNILSQVDIGHRSQFPCLLTTMKACDKKVAILMRQRGLGNSASQIHKKLQEQHSTEWYQKTIQYLSACKTVAGAASSGLVEAPHFIEPPVMASVPQYRWLMQVYIQDVLQRLPEVKANITSVFGRILKVDSTKKITKKLSGPTTGTAEWATNVGNEYGQVLMSVLTAGEGRFGLMRMAKGLMKRFTDAGHPPPEVIYVDRDCCGTASILTLFDDWQTEVDVRLDVWHFMRRLSSGCNTDSHPLYGLFMRRLSSCIFAWDKDDLQALKAAKRSELIAKHISDPSEGLVMRSITKNELALHCRRTTRGVDETAQLIEDHIAAFDGDKGKDTLGVPLLNSRRMKEEWERQKRHVACLQDPEGVQLYIQTGTLRKGRKVLPTYRCCRGSTSLESFHLHLNRFIPGTLANDTVFQAYLVDGLSRWNQDRSTAATDTKEPVSYSGLLQFTANKLAEDVFAKPISSYTPSRKYTGELIGIEYLYDQTGRPLQEYSSAIQQMEDTGLEVPDEDEGFLEYEAEDQTIPDILLDEERHTYELRQLQPQAPAKEQSKPQSPVIQRPIAASPELRQLQPQAPAKEQSKPQAPVIQRPIAASPELRQLQPQAPAKEQSKPQAPVIQRPIAASPELRQLQPQAPVKKQSKPQALLKEQSKPQASVKEQSKSQALVKEQSKSQAPVKEQSKSQAPVKEQSKSQAPVKEQSKSQAPAKEQSKSQAPVIQRPIAASPGLQSDISTDTTERQILQIPSDAEYAEMLVARAIDVDETLGPDGIPGYDKVQQLAAFLVDLGNNQLYLTNNQAEDLVNLWTSLDEYDKRPIIFTEAYRKESKGRFRAKRQAAPGVESTERSMRGPDSIPAAKPDCNRYVEAFVERLCLSIRGPRRREGQVWSRWSLILEAYSNIRTTVYSNAMVVARTRMQLPEISQKTLKAWHNNKARDGSRQVLHQGIHLPEASFTAVDPLPPPHVAPAVVPLSKESAFQFDLPVEATMTRQPYRKIRPAETIPSCTDSGPQPIIIQQLDTPVPYTTQRYRKRKAEEELVGRHRRKYVKVKPYKNCARCGGIIEKPSHRNYFGNSFCAINDGNYEEWKEQFRDKNYGRKK